MTFIDFDDILIKEPIRGYSVQFIHTANMTIAYWKIKAGAPLPDHSHPHEQVLNLVGGKYKLKIDDQSKSLGPGSVAVIPSNAPHSGEAITDCRIIDVFYPVRDDYL